LTTVADVQDVNSVVVHRKEDPVRSHDPMPDHFLEFTAFWRAGKAEGEVGQAEHRVLNGSKPLVRVSRSAGMLLKVRVVARDVRQCGRFRDDAVHSLYPYSDPQLGPKSFERLFRRPPLAPAHRNKPAIDSRDGLRTIQSVQQLLIGRGLLHDYLGPAIHRQHGGSSCLPQAPDVFASTALKVAEGVDI
jgi:hypothetical protein